MNWDGTPATVRLKFLSLKVGSGKTPLGGSQVYQDSGVLFIRSQNVHDDGLRLDDAVFISEEIDEEMEISRVQVGDVLLNITGASIGRVCAVPPGTQRANVNQHVCIIRPRSCTDSRFLAYSLQSGFGRSQVFASEVGVSREGLTFEQAGNIQIPAAEHKQQTRIAAFLDAKLGRLDELMRKKERQLVLLAEKRQALISHAVTRGLNPNAPTKHSGIEWLGNIPAHWDLKRLKFVARLQGGLAKGKDWEETETIELPYLRVANVQDGYIDLSEVKTITVGVREAKSYLLRKGDVLMNEGGDLDKLGRGTVWEGQIAPCLHQNHVFAIRPHRIDPYWFTYITRSGYSKAFFMQVGKQTTNLASVSASNLFNLPITLPPPDELASIRAFLDLALSRSAAVAGKLKTQLTKLHEYRQALITAAVTGQVAIPEEVAKPCVPNRRSFGKKEASA